ncbi:MAG: outer membrane lipoprotein-sorting protein [Pseudomonadales bacterium]|jgi:hypothetical protein|nr:outer membrane lipoprotein-sorting protein [Pseudomonadales bacterium]MDG1441323.1 outer membrane lipoprotein-sorting protein [Pseudomonadales bacterium]
MKFVSFLLLFLPLMAVADRDAKSLIDEMEALYRGESSKATMTMKVETPQYSRTMQMESSSVGQQDAFIRILSPKKDRGISTLKLDQEMWNFFPKINKVIKVPPSMMMGSWMGSDFTNDDLVKQTTLTEEYDLKLIETATQYSITLLPREQTVTVWGRIDYIVNKEHLVPVSQSFYDDDGIMIRKMVFSEVKDFGGRLMPSVMEMIPLNKEGHRTIIVYDNLEFDPPDVDKSIFTLRHLKSRF